MFGAGRDVQEGGAGAYLRCRSAAHSGEGGSGGELHWAAGAETGRGDGREHAARARADCTGAQPGACDGGGIGV